MAQKAVGIDLGQIKNIKLHIVTDIKARVKKRTKEQKQIN